MKVTKESIIGDILDYDRGTAEFFFEMKLSPWDYAAASLIIQEAGGFVSDLKGNPLTYDRRQTVSARAKNVELLDLTGIL